jgi:hypothetical protein
MLPFLKKKNEGGASASVDVIEREPDEGSEFDMLDAVVDDFMTAFEKKDKKLLKDALQALCEHLQDMDATQDEQTMEGIA